MDHMATKEVKKFAEYGNRMSDDYVIGLVSVITPVYNVEKYLNRTLDSVFRQTYKDIEIILVDDRSTDSSAEIIKNIQKKHPEVVYYLQPKNMGAGYARNKALELARGQYVAFLDSDDEWLPEKTVKQLNLMKKTKSPFSYGAIEMIDEDDHVIKGKRSVKESLDYKFLLSNTMIATSTVIVDRRVLGDFRMHLRRGGQDYATWLKLLRSGTVACGINEVVTRYRVTEGSLSSGKMKSVKQIWEIQTQDEGINKISAGFHLLKWGWNSVKKYYL